MKKRKILVGLFAATAALSLASCNNQSTPSSAQEVPSSVATPSSEAATPSSEAATPSSAATPSTDVTPSSSDEQKAAPKVSFYLDATANPTVIETVADKSGKYYIEDTPSTENYYKTFDGWFTEATGGTQFDVMDSDVTADMNLYAHWTAKQEQVTYAMDFNAFQTMAGGEKVKLTSDTTIGRFTCEAGSYFEGGNVINNQQKGIKFSVTGGGSLSFEAINGSASMVLTLYKITGQDENGKNITQIVKAWDSTTSKNYSDWDATPMQLEAGEYLLQSVGSARIKNLKIVDTVEKAAVESITVSPATTKFLKGREFDFTGLQITLVYGNGRTETVAAEASNVNATAFNKDASGTYTINVSYTLDENYGPQKDQVLTASYNASVYAIDTLSASTYSMDANRNTNAVQKVFTVGDTFNTKNLAVHAVAKCEGQADEDFLLKSGEYTVSTPVLTAAGVQTVTITSDGKTTSYDVYALAKVFAADATAVEVTVNPTAEVTATAEGVTVNTITQALQYLANADLSAECVKTIKVAPGTYFEKVDVSLENVRLIGTGENKAAVVIEFDGLNGLVDPSGTTAMSTDGAATFTVRGNGFYATNVTFKNKYNTHALYQASMAIVGKSTQATAVLVRADMVVFDGCAFTGYHDTLYADTGRQYYVNCDIEGRTDYIFGSSATAYFKNCNIKSLGAGTAENNGGYVVATKGDGVKYGYVFDGCTFDGDENVRDGSVSIARGWDTGMTIMVMNSTISAKFSKETYGEVTQYAEDAEYKKDLNDRYTKMNAAPVAAQLFEYNNTGAGALASDAETVAKYKDTVTIVTDATVAAKYADLFEVFATKNGSKTYNDVWNPAEAKDATIIIKAVDGSVIATLENVGYVGHVINENIIKNIIKNNTPDGAVFDDYYTSVECTTPFDFKAGLTAETVIVAKFDTGVQKVTLTYDGTKYADETNEWTTSMATAGSQKTSPTIGSNKDAADAKSIAKLCTNDYVLSPKFAPAKSVSLEMLSASTGTGNAINAFVYLLDADGNEVKKVTWEEVTKGKVTTKANITIDSETPFVQVKVAYSGNQKDKNFGIYSIAAEVILASEGQKETIIKRDTKLEFGPNFTNIEANETAEVNGFKLTPTSKTHISGDSTATAYVGKVEFKVAAGATVTVNGYAGYFAYTINGTAAELAKTSVYFAEETTVVIESTGNNHFYDITVEFKGAPVTDKAVATNTTFNISELLGQATIQGGKGTLGANDEITVDATTGKLGPNGTWPQFNTGTKITFKVKAGAKVAVTCYYNTFTVNGVASTVDGQAAFEQTYTEDTEITIIATGDNYIGTIAVTFGA